MKKLTIVYLFITLFSIIVLSCTKNSSQEQKNEERKNIPAEETANDMVSAEYEIMYVNSPDGLRVRSEPGLDGNKVGLLEYKARVEIMETDSHIVYIDGLKGQWKLINSGQTQGWVFGGYLEESLPQFKLESAIIGNWYIADKKSTDGKIFYELVYADFYQEKRFENDIMTTFNPDWGEGKYKYTISENKIMGASVGNSDYTFTYSLAGYIDEDLLIIKEGHDEQEVIYSRLKNDHIRRYLQTDDFSDFRRYIRNDGNIDIPMVFGQTPLMYSLISKKIDLMEYCLENGADINARDRVGYTPLFYAIMSDDVDLVKKVLDLGADINIKDIHGQKLLDYLPSRYINEELKELLIK
ncbi:hypothetical protein FACS189461_2500 [Spirochaetia bacterium]|nr:hypothetical protein FACS189461_2500 [Spirochaetia bacterium]